MRIRKRSKQTTVPEARIHLGNVCKWCGEKIDPDDVVAKRLLLVSSSPAADARQAMDDARTPPPARESCAAQEESDQSSSAAGTSLSRLIRKVFSQTPNASLTPRQALARMMDSGLCDGQDSAFMLEQVAMTMSRDPYFLHLKRGRFRMRTVEDATSNAAAGRTSRLLKATLPDFDNDEQGSELLCSCKNGNGWKCSQRAKPGYLLCEHHLTLSLKRKMRRNDRLKDEKKQRTD